MCKVQSSSSFNFTLRAGSPYAEASTGARGFCKKLWPRVVTKLPADRQFECSIPLNEPRQPYGYWTKKCP